MTPDAPPPEGPPERAAAIVARMLRDDAFSRWLGVEVCAVAPGRCTLRMTVRPEMLNGFGVAHGGITYALADSALAFASNTREQVALALENSMYYPAPVHAGDVLTATAEERSLTRRTAVYDVTVCRADGTKVGLFRGMVYRTKRPHP